SHSLVLLSYIPLTRCMTSLLPRASLLFLLLRPPPSSPLFPSTTLFRSGPAARARHPVGAGGGRAHRRLRVPAPPRASPAIPRRRSEEHTSELQSRENLVCRLLLEKKKKSLRSFFTFSSSALRYSTNTCI